MNVGDIITVKVDPETNNGLEDAPALVTGVYEDGSLRLRVFGSLPADDTVRNHTGDDGEPYVYPDAEQSSAPSAAPSPQYAPEPTGFDTATTQGDLNTQVAAISDEQAAELQAALDARSARQQPPDVTPA